jgi:ATP-dependent Clp protease adaptor protein ClpS
MPKGANWHPLTNAYDFKAFVRSEPKGANLTHPGSSAPPNARAQLSFFRKKLCQNNVRSRLPSSGTTVYNPSVFRPPRRETGFTMATATPTPEVLPEQETETRTRRQPPYAVILHNDDNNSMQFVVLVLRKVFGYTVEKCVELMLEAHEKGKAAVWIGALEVAELKADQIRSCGADPMVAKGAHPLGVSVEPAA